MDDLELEEIIDEIADRDVLVAVKDYVKQDVDDAVAARAQEIVSKGIVPPDYNYLKVRINGDRDSFVDWTARDKYLLGTDVILGVDWGDIGRGIMGGLHTAGGIVLNVFGAGEIAKNLEVAEAKAGLLPDWARTSASAGIPSAGASSAPAVPGEPAVSSYVAAPPPKSAATQKAEMRILAAKKKLADVQARPKAEYQPIAVNVPSFSFGGSTMSDSVVGDAIVGELMACGDAVACEVGEELEGERCGDSMYLLGSDIVAGLEPLVLHNVVLGALKASDLGKGKGGGKVAGPGKLGKKVDLKPTATKLKKLALQPSPHKKALARTLRIADRLDTVSKVISARAAQYKPSKHTSLVPLKPVAIKGEVILGATIPLTPKQQAAVQKHNNLVLAHKQAVERAKAAADKARQMADSLRADVIKYKPLIEKLLKAPQPVPRIMGDDYVLGDDQFDPFAETPPAQPTDAGLGTVYGGAAPTDDELDIPVPVRNKPMPVEEAWVAEFQKVPENGIVYDGRYGFGDNSLGSVTTWFKNGPEGVPAPDGGPGSGFALHGDGLYYRMGSNGKFQKANEREVRSWFNAIRSSVNHNWGPIIGNPNSKFAGLQFAQEDSKWFWLPDNAPSWATRDQDQAIIDLNKKNREARRLEDVARRAQAEKERLEQEEAKAKQAAANALAESAADSQAKIAEQAAAAKQRELDLQQQKSDQELAVQYAQQDLRERQARLDAGILPGYESYGGEYGGEGEAFDEGYSEDRGMPDEMYAEESRSYEEETPAEEPAEPASEE